MPHVGLVLGAGGLAGHAFHAGVLRALDEVAGWDARDADVVVGTSAGSGVAAYLRAGVPPGDLAARVAGREPSPEGQALLSHLPALAQATRPGISWPPSPQALGLLGSRVRRPWTIRPGHLLASLVPAGTASTEGLEERIRLLHPAHWPPRALWICAVRLSDGERVVFGRDPSPEPDLGTAVAASSAIPGWFHPVEIDGERFVDGAVHSPTNADLVAGLALDVVVVSSPMSSGASTSVVPPSNPARMFHTAVLEREVRAVQGDGTPVLVFQPDRNVLDAVGYDAMDLGRMAAIAERSYSAALEVLEGSAVMLR